MSFGRVIAVLSLGMLTACDWRGSTTPAEVFCRRLDRGINLGNALESPRERSWGVTPRPEYFRLMRDAGFDAVRLPVRWSDYAATNAPYTIEPAFFATVDAAVQTALSSGLAVVLNVHHYEELNNQPDAHRERFLALWGQIAAHYREYPGILAFELLNEPCRELNDERWNALAADAFAVVRASNPKRIVIIGSTQWNSVEKLGALRLPENDGRIIASFHYYKPMQLTHQGAEWVDGSDRWRGTTWTGTPAQLAALRADLDGVAAWAASNGVPLYLGEFGVYMTADMTSRVCWTASVAREAERRGMAWAYWEFCSGFGVYNPIENTWRTPLREALQPSRPPIPEHRK
jgi:endoglucanase